MADFKRLTDAINAQLSTLNVPFEVEASDVADLVSELAFNPEARAEFTSRVTAHHKQLWILRRLQARKPTPPGEFMAKWKGFDAERGENLSSPSRLKHERRPPYGRLANPISLGTEPMPDDLQLRAIVCALGADAGLMKAFGEAVEAKKAEES